MENLEKYWSDRYVSKNTGWDIGFPSTPIKSYIDQIRDKKKRILIPGAGNAYEAEYIFKQGFQNVFILDISPIPLNAFSTRVPSFPSSQLLQEDFFKFQESFDLIIEQTFFCSFEPSEKNRKSYAKKMNELLSPKGKLVGLWFDHALQKDGKRPFGGSKEEYLKYFQNYFKPLIFERSINSIKPRMGKELFGIFEKKEMVK